MIAGKRGLSVRWRLTIVYTSVAVASAAVLLTGIYVLVSRDQPPGALVARFGASQMPSLTPVEGDVVIEQAVIEARDAAVDGTLENLLLWSGLGLMLMAAVSVAVGWAFAGRSLRPVHTITSRARQISADALDERFRLEGPLDELKEMADTFDALLDRIQETVDSERRLVATMSHELRTPLANQRAALDVALADPGADPGSLRRAAEVALGQAERAERTIDALLTLARVQSGEMEPRLLPVELDRVAADAAAAVQAEGLASGLRWEVELDPATVPGDSELLARAVGNLLENAVVHNLPGGWVRVRLVSRVGSAELQVVNSGPPIDPESVGELILPFRRGTRDRTSSARGTGLGLTIVQGIATHHGARLTLRAQPEGGIEASFVLPLVA